MYLDFAENQAKRGVIMKMDDWIKKLDAFLEFNGYEILQNLGKVKKSVADAVALKEYEAFRVVQDKEYVSDFDKMIKKILEKKE